MTRGRVVWALGVAAFALAIPAAYLVGEALPLGYDFRAYWLAARHLIDGAPLYPALTAKLGQPDEFHYLPIVAAPFIPFLLLPIDVAADLWTALLIALAGAVGIVLIRPLPFAARPWVAAAYVFFLPMVLEVTLGNVDLISVALALVAWDRRTRPNSAVIPYAAAIGIKFLPLSLLPFYLGAGHVRVVVRAFALGLVALVATVPFLPGPNAEYVALLPRYLDTEWARAHAERESPAWMAQIAWSDWFPLVLAIVAIALAAFFGRQARRDPAREREWHRLSLALAPYVTPFGFIWTTYLICSLPLFALTISKALRLAPTPRLAALAGMVACWVAMQIVQVHDLLPIVAHMAGVIGLIAIALLVMALERQTEGRSTPRSRATRVASG